VYKKIQVNVQDKIRVQFKVFDELAKIMAKVASADPCYNFRVQFKGSSYEGLKIGKPDEFDYGLVKDAWRGKITLDVDGTKKKPPVGFGYAVPTISTCLDKFIIPGTKHLDADKIRGHLRNLVEDAMLKLGMKGKEVVKPPWQGGLPNGEYLLLNGILRGQTTNGIELLKISNCRNRSSVLRMPKMRAIPQLVSAPLNPIPIAEHFRRSHPRCEHSYRQDK